MAGPRRHAPARGTAPCSSRPDSRKSKRPLWLRGTRSRPTRSGEAAPAATRLLAPGGQLPRQLPQRRRRGRCREVVLPLGGHQLPRQGAGAMGLGASTRTGLTLRPCEAPGTRDACPGGSRWTPGRHGGLCSRGSPGRLWSVGKRPTRSDRPGGRGRTPTGQRRRAPRCRASLQGPPGTPGARARESTRRNPRFPRVSRGFVGCRWDTVSTQAGCGNPCGGSLDRPTFRGSIFGAPPAARSWDGRSVRVASGEVVKPFHHLPPAYG